MFARSLSLVFLCSILTFVSCSDGEVNETTNSETVNSNGIDGTYAYKSETYMYAGTDEATGRLNFKEKIDATGLLIIEETADGGLKFTEKPNEGMSQTFIATSYTKVDQIVYFTIPEGQPHKQDWTLNGSPLAWNESAGDSQGYAGELNLETEKFRIQYAVKRSYEGADGEVLSETRYLRKLSSE